MDNNIIIEMFKEIAVTLKLNYRETTALRQNKFYELYNDKFNFSFSVIIDPRNGNVIITSKNIRLQPYKKDELMSKAKKEIIVKLNEIINKS